MWYTWFDRDLTVAGRVIVREKKDGAVSYAHKLVRVQEPVMRIPTLAIHLDRLVLATYPFLCFIPVIKSMKIGPTLNFRS